MRLILPYCEECGEVRVPHVMSRSAGYLEDGLAFMGPAGRAFKLFADQFEVAFSSYFTPRRVTQLAQFCTRAGIGTFNTTAAGNDNTRTLALYEGAAPCGVTLRAFKVFGAPICFIAEKEVNGVVEQVMFGIIPRPNGFVSPSLPWMDDKGILKQKLAEAKLPHAEGGVAETLDEAIAIFRKVGRPVIAKPRSGSRGRHTTLDMRDESELTRGFNIAKQLSKGVVIERYLKGTVHRVTLVGGEPVAVARREYPHVIGDGVHTVLELIRIENEKPYRNGVHFRKISTEHRVAQSLKKQDLTPESVPEEGRMVILNDKNSRLHGTLTEDVTKIVHPENLELFRCLGDMLGDPIVGVDFMIHDMSRSWKEQPDAGFIECNSMPFIDVHHRVVSGERINVAEHLWNEVFKVK